MLKYLKIFDNSLAGNDDREDEVLVSFNLTD